MAMSEGREGGSGVMAAPTTDRDARILEMRAQGRSLGEIATEVGLSTTRVSRILRDGGAPTQARPTGSRRHVCATPGCGRRISAERSVYSHHTGQRYCWPTEGCTLWTDDQRRRRRLAAERRAAP